VTRVHRRGIVQAFAETGKGEWGGCSSRNGRKGARPSFRFLNPTARGEADVGWLLRWRLKRALKWIDADYTLAASVLSHQFTGAVIPKELARLLQALVDAPGPATAIALLEYDPGFLAAFELACRGGTLERGMRNGTVAFRPKAPPDDLDGDDA